MYVTGAISCLGLICRRRRRRLHSLEPMGFLLWFSVLCFLFSVTFFCTLHGQEDARRVIITSKNSVLLPMKLKKANRMVDTYSSSYLYGGGGGGGGVGEGYVGSPFTMPPYDDAMGSPPPSPPQEPIYCVYPPPSTTTPPSTNVFSPPPSPPFTTTPSSTNVFSPPPFTTTPPSITVFSPPPPITNFPSPPQFVPGPPIFQPPVVYPPPRSGSPLPPSSGSGYTLWCVAKPSVPDPIILEAMNYACGSGADCESIEPKGSCYEPNTVIAHASFAFNSYWQRTRVAGATCDFGGTAMLVTKDPSFDGCKFLRT